MPTFNPPHYNGHRMTEAQLSAFSRRNAEAYARELRRREHRGGALNEAQKIFLRSNPPGRGRGES